MEKRLNLLWNKGKNYMQLASVNREAISEYNEKMLFALTLIGGILMMLPVLAAPFSNSKTEIIPAYLLVSTVFFAIFFIFRLSFIKKYARGGLYVCFSR